MITLPRNVKLLNARSRLCYLGVDSKESLTHFVLIKLHMSFSLSHRGNCFSTRFN